MKSIKILLVVIIVLIIACGIVFTVSQNKLAEEVAITEDFNLKIVVVYDFIPGKTVKYYFYEDFVIKTEQSGGLHSEGLSTTKYYFDNEIDLTELNNYIESAPKGTSKNNIAEIIKSDGKVYYIDNPGNNESDFMKQSELTNEIEKITDNAIKEKVK